MAKGNNVYSWGNMDSVDTGAMILADGVQVPMRKINQLPNNLGPIEQYTSDEIEELLSEQREHDRASEFTRLNVDTTKSLGETIAAPSYAPIVPPPTYSIPAAIQTQYDGAYPSPPTPKLSALSPDDLWEKIIEAQDQLRKYYLELGGRRVPGAGKWLMANVQYINSSQMEGIAIRNGFAPESLIEQVSA